MTSADTYGSNTVAGGRPTALDADPVTVDGEWAGSTGLLGLGKLTTLKVTSGSSLPIVVVDGLTDTSGMETTGVLEYASVDSCGWHTGVAP